MENNHEVYTVPELAAILKIGRNAAYDLVKSGKIHSIRIGKSIRIPHACTGRIFKFLTCCSKQSVLYLPHTRKMLR